MTEDNTNEGPILFIDISKGNEQNHLLEVASEPLINQKLVELSTTDTYLEVQPKRVRCNICHRYSAENEEKMLRHIRKVHRGENPFQCCMCDYSTYNKSLFDDHVRIHQGIKPFKCSHCSYRSVSKKNTKKHELIHRANNPLRCQECPFIARNHRVLNCHRQKYHPVVEDSTSAVKCPKCDTKFPDEAGRANHMKSRRKCLECDSSFCKQLLNRHMTEAHSLGQALPPVKKIKKVNLCFKCKLCKWSTNSKFRFLLHLIHHPGQDVNGLDLDLSVLRKYGILPELEEPFQSVETQNVG